LGVDSAFLKKENKLSSVHVKCAACGSPIRLYVNSISSARETWPFCEKCGTYVDVMPSD
jgi:hypothetical protein